ncbi:MAG: polysaccharide biosynthesis protein [Saprospiraceae bacterium]|nr:polysaccharide biosynthesis protein [Saprospiraceae bacterium]
MFDLKNFISSRITHRAESLFLTDVERNHFHLYDEIRGKSVLVIGGAGTIGSSFIKALLPFKPGALTVVDYNENGLTELTRDLRSSYNELLPEDFTTYPFDFGGPVFEKLIASSRFEVVACFAAHKHVRSEKDHLAIEAMIRNNVFNTQRLLELLSQSPPQHFFAVSTDKAANPVNVMGASKKLMEKVLLAYAAKFKIVTARFANVAFSNGSLLYGFEERMRKQQPLSAPKDVRRYFVSPEESGQLCLLACILGESGDIFFPKLDEGQMQTFSSIATQYLQDRGLIAQNAQSEEEARALAREYQPGDPYPVYFFDSNTSGEKLYEEFYTASDTLDVERFEGLGVVHGQAEIDIGQVAKVQRDFETLFAESDVTKEKIVSLLGRYLDDFKHQETGQKLDDRL